MIPVQSISANDIIQDALEDLGVYGPGDTVSAADQDRMFFLLNSLLDEWAGENIFVLETATENIALGVGEASYAVGPPRWVGITYGQGAGTVTVGDVTTGVNSVSAVEFRMLSTSAPAPGTPDTVWYDTTTYPAGALNVLPPPSAVGTLSVLALYRLIQFEAPTQEYTLGQGVLDAVRYNLAVYAKSYFTSAQIDPIIPIRAAIGTEFLRYQSQTSRAMFNRFPSSNPAKAPQ